MRIVFKKFTEHPAEMGETYLKHMLVALKCSARLYLAAAACMIHAFVPFLFTTTATNISKNVIENRIKQT